MEYLVRFVQAYETFRHPELETLARLANVKLEIIQYSPDSPFCVIRLVPLSSTLRSPDDVAASFISRSLLSKGIYELWAEATDYETLHEIIKNETTHLWPKHSSVTFKFTVDAFYGKRSEQEQRDIINSFRYLGFKGKTDMKNPQAHFLVFEEWEDDSAMLSLANLALAKSTHQTPSQEQQRPDSIRKPKRIFLARHLGNTSRHLADKHDLKKRPYISTTSMDALLALMTANLALASPGKLFLDPFVGTGGFMIAASELGATTLGADIDGRSFRGKSSGIEKGVGANLKKYNLTSLFGDCITSDLTNTPFRLTAQSVPNQSDTTRWLDGIISDPPYGIREGLKVLGVRKAQVNRATRISDQTSQPPNPKGPYLIEGAPAHLLPGYIPPKKPYSFTAMLDDIMNFAAATLVDGGRLAFWMPSANETSEDGDTVMDNSNTNNATNTANTDTNSDKIPTHPLLNHKHTCTQQFNKWSRKLLVYERIPGEISPPPPHNSTSSSPMISTSSTPAQTTTTTSTPPSPPSGTDNMKPNPTANDLNPFRKLYFQGFQHQNQNQHPSPS